MRHSQRFLFLAALMFGSILGEEAGAQFLQQGTKLVGTGAVGIARQGSSVALSADGNTAIVGGYFDNSGAGAAWVFSRSGSLWSQQASKLVGAGAVGDAGQGGSVSLSADGNTAIVGGYFDNRGAGAAWVFTRSATSVREEAANVPSQFVLEQNFPNPFNPSTTIRYGLPHKSAVQLTVFNPLGQRVAVLVDGDIEAGFHEIKFDGSKLASGVYLYRMQAESYLEINKLLLVR